MGVGSGDAGVGVGAGGWLVLHDVPNLVPPVLPLHRRIVAHAVFVRR